jgi:hypothetical protein
MKNIRTAIFALCLGTLGSMAALAQYGSFGDGPGALAANTSGSYDAAFGYYPLASNNNGVENSAFGAFSLYANTYGSGNTAFGGWSLYSNVGGGYNTASGLSSLYENTSGQENAADGYAALYSNTTGGSNIAVGPYALYTNTTGSNNIAIGSWSAYDLAAGSSYNIDIGNSGASSDNGVIRIGSNGNQGAFFAGGVRGVKTGLSNAVEVMIDGNGQLGTINSSLRFKEDVHDMAAASDGLMQLRPVTYRYKQPYADGSKPLDYGLIAEEVAKVYPDLVARDASGQIQTVQYQKLTPMLLNEVQKERQLLEAQEETIQLQEKSIQLLEKRLEALEAAHSSASSDASFARK